MVKYGDILLPASLAGLFGGLRHGCEPSDVGVEDGYGSRTRLFEAFGAIVAPIGSCFQLSFEDLKRCGKENGRQSSPNSRKLRPKRPDNA